MEKIYENFASNALAPKITRTLGYAICGIAVCQSLKLGRNYLYLRYLQKYHRV